ncbi:MAG TPA: N-acetylmuramoyl-L-alanine amidase [Pyrinomonadaceae bacterium]
MANGTVVIDPGHGGSVEIGGSSANNAISASGVLEKNITLRMAFLVRDALKELATLGGHTLQIHLTRDTDKNLGLCDRAKVAKTKSANIFLSIHCNGFDKTVRGTETLIRLAASNPKHAADKALAQRVQKAVFNAIKSHDANAKNRGVKDQLLGVLNRNCLGSKPRGCMVEMEFIDVPAVDKLLNIGPNSPQVRSDIAKAIAGAIIDDLIANP